MGGEIYRLRPLSIIKLLLIKVQTDSDERQLSPEQEALQTYMQAIIRSPEVGTFHIQFSESKLEKELTHSVSISLVTCV